MLKTSMWVAAVVLGGAGTAFADPKFEFGKADEVKKVKGTEWTAAAEAGVVLTTGNSETLTGTGGFKATRKQGNNKLALEASGTYARSKTIGSGTRLRAGWWTQAKYTRLVVQLDGNLVMYRNSDGKAIWSSGTSGHSGAYAYMQSDGNFVVYKSGGGPGSGGALWSTGTYGHSGAYAIMQDDGNFVVYKSGGGPGLGGYLWASGTYTQVP